MVALSAGRGRSGRVASGERVGGLAAGLGVCAFVGGDFHERSGGDARGAGGLDAVGGGEEFVRFFGFDEFGEFERVEAEDVAEEGGRDGRVGE